MHENATGLLHKQMGELYRNVSRLALQNHKKYQQIILSKPFYEYQLYKVPEIQQWQKTFARELLMKQLDKLIDEERLLDRELSKIQLQDEEIMVEKQ